MISFDGRKFVEVNFLKESGFITDPSSFFHKIPETFKLKIVPQETMVVFEKFAELSEASVKDWIVSVQDPRVENVSEENHKNFQYLDLVDQNYLSTKVFRAFS